MKLFILNSLFLSICCILDYNFSLGLNFNSYKLSSIFYNPNHFAYYLVIAINFLIGLILNETSKFRYLIYIFFYMIILYVFIANNTFGCYIGFLLSIFLFSLYAFKFKKIKSLLIVLLITFFLSISVRNISGNIAVINNFKTIINESSLAIKNNNDNEKKDSISVGNRSKLWKYSIVIFLKKPITGYGMENLYNSYLIYGLDEDLPHNEFLQIACCNGIFALISYLLFIYSTVLTLFKNMNSNDFNYVFLITILSYLLSSFFGNIMFYTTLYFFMLLAFSYCKKS